MGHFCRICARIRANERFSGKGRRDHVCQDCARLPRAVREKIDLQEELNGFLHQSHISPKNQTRLQSLIAHPDSEIARAATVLLELARKYPYRRRRLVRLRRERDFVHRLMTELPPGIWEGYVNRFGDFLEDPYELLPGFDPMAESTHPASDGVATSSLPFETLCKGDEDIATPLLFSMGAVSNFAPEDPGPDPEPDEPICWEACEPIQPPFDDWRCPPPDHATLFPSRDHRPGGPAESSPARERWVPSPHENPAPAGATELLPRVFPRRKGEVVSRKERMKTEKENPPNPVSASLSHRRPLCVLASLLNQFVSFDIRGSETSAL